MEANYMLANCREPVHFSESPWLLPSPLKLLISVILITSLLTAHYMLIATCGGELWLSVFEQIRAVPRTINDHAFTPLHLFFLLNLLIVSIILMTRLHKEASPHSQTADHSPIHRTKHQNQKINPQHRTCSKDVTVANGSAAHPSTDDADTDLLATDVYDGSLAEAQEVDHREMAAESDYVPVVDAGGSYGGRVDGASDVESTRCELQDPRGAASTCAGFGNPAELVNLKISGKKPLTSVQERPLASAHFPHKKFINRAQASKSPLRISRPSARKGDTLDATWKAICEDKSTHSTSPIRHHITTLARKGACRMGLADESVEASININKDPPLSCLSPSKQRRRMPSSSAISGFIKRRELSLTRDELNARVESFISNFHQQIRIQREQSLLGYQKKH